MPAPSSYLRRPTVRTWDISDPDNPKLKAVSFLPDGPRVGKVAAPRGAAGGMETTVTNLPGHKGAFAQTMQGGAIYYTPDITADEAGVARGLRPHDRRTSTPTRSATRTAAARNGGWIQTSLDDKYLYHAVDGRQPSGTTPGSPPYILKLDIQELLASGTDPTCNIDTIEETVNGGAESRLPGGRRHRCRRPAARTGARWTTSSSARTATTTRPRT